MRVPACLVRQRGLLSAVAQDGNSLWYRGPGLEAGAGWPPNSQPGHNVPSSCGGSGGGEWLRGWARRLPNSPAPTSRQSPWWVASSSRPWLCIKWDGNQTPSREPSIHPH